MIFIHETFMNLHNLRKCALQPCGWSCHTKTAQPALCLWGLYGVLEGSTAGWALPCRFTPTSLTGGRLPPAANLIMYPERGLNYSTRPPSDGSTYLVFKAQTKYSHISPLNELAGHFHSLFWK